MNYLLKSINLSVFFIILLFNLAFAQEGQMVSLESSNGTWLSTDVYKVEFQFQVQEGLHIQAVTPDDEFLIPTSMKLWLISSVKDAAVHFPEPELRNIEGYETKVFSDKLKVEVLLRFQSNPGEANIRGTLQYQACNDAKCFYPRNLPFTIKIVEQANMTSNR